MGKWLAFGGSVTRWWSVVGGFNKTQKYKNIEPHQNFTSSCKKMYFIVHLRTTASKNQYSRNKSGRVDTALTQLSSKCSPAPPPYPSPFSLHLSSSFKSEDILGFYKPPPNLVLKNFKNPSSKQNKPPEVFCKKGCS